MKDCFFTFILWGSYRKVNTGMIRKTENLKIIKVFIAQDRLYTNIIKRSYQKVNYGMISKTENLKVKKKSMKNRFYKKIFWQYNSNRIQGILSISFKRLRVYSTTGREVLVSFWRNSSWFNEWITRTSHSFR